MKWSSRTRCALVCLGFTAVFSLFSVRLIYLQMIEHDEYAERAAEKNIERKVIFAERGAIFDSNNEILADNVPVERVVADATHFTDANAVVDLLSSTLKIPRSELAEKLESDRRYIVIKHEVP